MKPSANAITEETMLRVVDASPNAIATIGPSGAKAISGVPKRIARHVYTPAAIVPAIASGAPSCGVMIPRAQMYPMMKWSTAFATNGGELLAIVSR